MSKLLDNTIKLIFSKVKANFINKTDTVITEELSVDTVPTTDSTNLITSGGVKAGLEDVREVAEGKTKSYVCAYATNPILNSQDAVLDLTTSLTDTDGNVIPLSALKKSDNILIIETDVPDRWCVPQAGGTVVKLYKLETAKVPVNAVKNGNSQSLVDATGAAIIPTAVDGIDEQPGMVKINSALGIKVGTGDNAGILEAVVATETEIANRNSGSVSYNEITPSNYDSAVKHALCDAAGATYNATEQAAARERINASATINIRRV